MFVNHYKKTLSIQFTFEYVVHKLQCSVNWRNFVGWSDSYFSIDHIIFSPIEAWFQKMIYTCQLPLFNCYIVSVVFESRCHVKTQSNGSPISGKTSWPAIPLNVCPLVVFFCHHNNFFFFNSGCMPSSGKNKLNWRRIFMSYHWQQMWIEMLNLIFWGVKLNEVSGDLCFSDWFTIAELFSQP